MISVVHTYGRHKQGGASFYNLGEQNWTFFFFKENLEALGVGEAPSLVVAPPRA